MLHSRFREAFEREFRSRQKHASPDSITPKISTAAMTGQMVVNSAALKLMGLRPYDTIYLLDLKETATHPDARYFATSGFEVNNKWFGSKIHENGKLNNSAFYNSLISNGTITLIDNLLMVERGYFIRHGKEKFKALKRVTMFVERYVETMTDGTVNNLFVPAPGVSPRPFFRLYGRIETSKV